MSELARNTSWMFLGQVISLLIQAVYFVIIARALGAQQYGVFVASTAFPMILSPFVGFGGGNLLIKNVAHDRTSFPVYWGNWLFMTLASGLTFIAFVIFFARLVLPATIPLLVIVSVSLAELIFIRLVECAAMAFQAVGRLDVTAQLHIWSALAKLVGIAVLAVNIHHPTAQQWSFVYLITTVIGTVLGLYWVQTRIDKPRLELCRIKGEFIEGLYFSTSLSAQNIYNDIDKTMLARLSTLDAVGIYATAYRLIDVAFVPVRSLLAAGYSGFFRAGKEGLDGTLRYMWRLLPKSACFSLLVFLCLITCAPIIPYVFGPQFLRTVEALRWLALLPLLKTIHYFLADTLTCSGYQGYRTTIQIVVAVFNVLINLWIIPLFSWRGAAWSSLASDGLLAVLLYITILVLRGRPGLDKDNIR